MESEIQFIVRMELSDTPNHVECYCEHDVIIESFDSYKRAAEYFDKIKLSRKFGLRYVVSAFLERVETKKNILDLF